ncbi:uncharacterized protein LOC143361121 [Halictus rubicundus]|uniref:uncharacterized protein LOC143361121 n=1 Tax=Halictus rubicundus TaxID=77578 RepID=UPI004035C9B8
MAIYEENDLHLTENICKNIELKVHQNLLSTNYEILEQRKTVLKEERTKMNNINSTVWTVEDKFCNEVWDFYLQHNFNIIFKPYPNITEIIECHNCKYSTVPYNYAKSINTIEEDKITELKNEIDNINNQRTCIHNEDIEESITNAMYILDNLKSFSEEILHLIRLVNSLENSQNVCNTLAYKKPKTNKGFKSAEKYLKNRPIITIGENVATSSNNFTNINTPKKVDNQKLKICKGFKGAEKYSKNHPITTIGENVATSSNNFTKIADTPKKRPRVISNIRLGKFTLKKQSIVSLKLKK